MNIITPNLHSNMGRHFTDHKNGTKKGYVLDSEEKHKTEFKPKSVQL